MNLRLSSPLRSDINCLIQEVMVKEIKNNNSLLSGYRFLDLTDEKGLLCSRIHNLGHTRITRGLALYAWPWVA